MATVLRRFLLLLLLTLRALGAAAAEDVDPPARVGGASLVEGDVAYLRDGEWVPLPVNWPITTGTRLSAAPGARAEVRVGSTALRLAGATELEFARLDDDAIALRLLSGTIDARVRSAEVARELSVETPEARATLLEPGRYRFDTGLVVDTTAVSTELGVARVEAGDNAVVVRAGRRAEVWRNGDFRLADARSDAFDEWALARDRRYDASQSARYVSPETTGYESLDGHGDWREVPQYGPVWIPRAVPAGWAPYRAGRWAWIAPWGWTWIDEAPWGFAPFHYGRWAFVGGIWCWVPGRVVARPVYAPALVGWVGGPGWSVSVSVGAVPAVGWFPLAPREVYVPAYRHSRAYVRNVNVAHVTNVTQITTATNVNYVNRRIERAVTVVPASAVTSGQPVARSRVDVRRAELDRHAHASPTQPVAPRGDDARLEPRSGHRDDARRAEAPRSAAPAAIPSPTPVQPRSAPRVLETHSDPGPAPRREMQRTEPPRGTAPPPSVPQQAQARPEQRRQVQRVEPPRMAAPAQPAPPSAQPRLEARSSPPTPVVRAAPSGPQPRPQSGPRGDRERGHGREQRRKESDKAG